jgi:hypothetical protein
MHTPTSIHLRFDQLAALASFVAICLGLSFSLHADDAFFEKQIRPLLIKRCYSCHAGTKNNGGLSLQTRAGWEKGGESGPAIIPSKPDDSLLIDAINYRDLEMPPKDKGGKLPDEEIALLTKWVQLGAPDPRTASIKLGGMPIELAKSWWSFQPLPNLEDKPEPDTVDRFLLDKIRQQQLKINDHADKRTLIRRATYDLTGLPPTKLEVEAFLADQSPIAFAKLVDRLLDSPQYGVKWGRHWLDVVRYADTAGENTDRPLPHAWRYRNWVFDSFHRDSAYDEFVRLQIAGDLLHKDSEGQKFQNGIVATGYLAVARRFGHDIDKDIHLMHEDVIDNLGKNFLGMTLGCARCHDHKYDPISAEDYYALYGIFQSSRFSFPGCEPKGQPRDLVPLVTKETFDATMAKYQKELAEYNSALAGPKEETERLKLLANNETTVLSKALVAEGKSVSLSNAEERLAPVKMKKGEVLQLVVLPNGNYGADTTLLEWRITQQGAPKQTWSTSDLISDRMKTAPMIEDREAIWCLLYLADGPLFLPDKSENISGKPSLNGWARKDTPSAFANTSAEPVAVWTTLPPKSLFVHPGPTEPVMLAWICPKDGTYEIEGRVADAHPSGGDGISFRLEHHASAEFGEALANLGRAAKVSKPIPVKPVFPVAYAVVDAEPKNARLHERGDPELLGSEVPRRWLSVFGGDLVAKDAGSGRIELATWVSQHPLTARVMVNRIWQGHFGQGLVATPNDFGSRGDRPSHPELLDWLASHFVKSSYSVKSMHRLVMNTKAYQRSSVASDPKQQLAQLQIDANNRFLARFTRRRITAEEIRDSMLAIGNNLDLTPAEAHPFPETSKWNFTQHNPFNALYDSNRRSAYLMVQRQRRHPYLALFDGADPNASTGIRQTTTVPTQALYFLNSPFFHAQAKRFADQIVPIADDDLRLAQTYSMLYHRAPTATEQNNAEGFLSRYPGSTAEKWQAYCRVLMASNEFLYID